MIGSVVSRSSFNQGVGGSIPARVTVSLSMTLNPEMLPVAVATVRECKSLRINALAKYHVMKRSLNPLI